mmetsp:Transcript_37153/g.45359  ORF Transcript_37153/g.45359 Transcript_37153/m.45359 type:complete len:299 (-) Transcript_37153:255-1151(-)|eukprot:CAMPEP_0170454520 /NCGR_PEP_ID=MMETSP0123-20130129/2748_1 /TAXON_ID=182087 /ORGANISM="Favella ehrenbergii, Strain Fehren 1" /LENGTH=298 /DNA_ID=CAMNT_0010717267 /DNA_START=167 /DNA_END=1063 /DNA_ORIENTATION=+
MNPAGAFLVKKWSPKILIAVGSSLGVAAFCISTTVATFSGFIVCFSVIYGAGIGLCYFAPLACGWEWLPERKGLVTGTILGAFGFGAFFFSFLSQAVVNPENSPAEKQPDGTLIYTPEIASRVPKLMFTLAACFAALGLISVLLVRSNPAYREEKIATDLSQLTIKEALRERQYWVLCAMDFLTIFPLFYMASVYKAMGMQMGGFDDSFLTVIGSVGSLANGLSRVGWGAMQDRTGFRPIYRVVLMIELLFCSLMPLVVTTNRYMYLIWVFMGYLCLGAHFVIFPNCIIAIFGLRSSV